MQCMTGSVMGHYNNTGRLFHQKRWIHLRLEGGLEGDNVGDQTIRAAEEDLTLR